VSTAQGGEVEGSVAQQIRTARGGGKPLDDTVRGKMERGFGRLIGGSLSNLYEVLPDAVEAEIEDAESIVHPLQCVAAFLEADDWSWKALPYYCCGRPIDHHLAFDTPLSSG
jgi:hypothetical protein